MAARALGLLMLESRALADRLRLETEGLVDALLQLVAYCRRSRTQTPDTRRVHVNCCLVISLLMQAAPQQQQHLQLVVSLDSELLILRPLPSKQESENLLLTVAGRPESGDICRSVDDERGDVLSSLRSIDLVVDKEKRLKSKRLKDGDKQLSHSRTPGSTNQQSPSRQHHPKMAWTEINAELRTDHEVGSNILNSTHRDKPTSGKNSNGATPEHLARGMSELKPPSRTFQMDRFRVMTPAFPRQYTQEPPISPLPLIHPSGGYRIPGTGAESEHRELDDVVETGPINAPVHPISDTLLHPKHMLEIFRTHQMPVASQSYFQQHLRDNEDDARNKKGRRAAPSRLQVIQWDKWSKEQHNCEDESEHEAITAVTAIPRVYPRIAKTVAKDEAVLTVERTDNISPSAPVSSTKLTATELEPTTPIYKRQRLREILTAPVEPDEHNVQQLRALAQRVNTSVMASLGSEVTRMRHEELQTRQEMHSMIQQERERLPLKFLFQLPGGAAYCRHRMRRAMALWLLEFEDNLRRMALMQWKAVVEHARYIERGEEYHRIAIKKRLKVAVEYVLRGYQQHGFRKWVESIQVLIWSDRDAAARLIQANIRRHLERKRFLTLHRRAPFANPELRDIYLAPIRPHLPFQIPREVREHRRKLWQSAQLVQSVYRYRRFRVALTRYRAAVVKIQTLQRMRAACSRYHHLRRQITLVQARVRMRVCRGAFLTLRNAVLLVQSVFRSVRMRRLRRLVLCAQRKETERVLSSIVLLQRVARGFIGRCATRKLRAIRDEEWHAALIFQRCWYKRNNEWSTFLLLGCLREKENEEREFDARVLAYKRNHMARVIHHAWLEYLTAKHNNAAALIQRNVRRLAAQRFVEQMRQQEMAHRRIKWFFRVHHTKRILRATQLQFWWLKAAPGRLRRHLHVRLVEDRQERMRHQLEREQDASARIQALVRGHMGRKFARCERSVRLIQRIIRIYLQRKHFKEELARIRTHIARHTTDKCVAAALNKILKSTMERFNTSASEIQRTFRGYNCRARVRRSIVHTELRIRMAIRIQLKWRQNTHYRTARKLLDAQRRKQINPFRSEDVMSVIIDKMIAMSSEFYNPGDELQGMAVQEWLHRLGLAAKYSELFLKNRWIMAANPADALKRLRELKHDACEEKLETIGVTNAEDMHVLLTNLFAFQTVEDTKRHRRALVLAREKQSILQRACDSAQKHFQACLRVQEQREIALHEVLQEAQEFRNPPHAVRTKQVACTLELENAVKETSKADAKCNNAAALLDEHKRELATRLRQFATQQEPKEISAVHSLHSFRLIDQLNVAREMFLEQFPGLDARALAFVSSLEENRITRWQLQRFFEAHTTVSEVKHNMKELTFFMHETEVKKHNYSRFGQCADALQFGHERLAELLDISLEVLVLGIDRTDVTKRKLLDRIVLGAILDARNARGNDDKARIWCKGASTLGKMNAAAITLQSLWRRRAGKKLVAELRANRRHQELRKQYITELRTDHVTPIWQAERKKEQEDLDAWLKGEAKAHRMRVLYNILRYPYVEEWDDNAQTYVYAMYSQQNTSVGFGEGEKEQWRTYVTDKPTYTIEEEDMAVRIQAQIRRFLTQLHIHELQRLQRRQRRRDILEAEWNNSWQERSQLLTLTFQFQFHGNKHVSSWLRGRVKSKPAAHPHAHVGPPAKSQTKRGTSSNKPMESPTATQAKTSPKRANGTLKGGNSKNTVDGNKTAGKDHLPRLHTALDSIVSALEPIYHESMRTEHSRNWGIPVHSRPGNAHGRSIVRFLEQLQGFYRQTALTTQAETRLRYTKMALRFGWEEVEQVQVSTAKSGNVTATRSYFFNATTNETSWERPEYCFEEQFAATRIQTLGRVIVATNTRERELAAFSFVAAVQDAIQKSARIGWVGYSLEGMTSAVFLTRLGLTKHVTSPLGKMSVKELLDTVISEQHAKNLGWSKEEATLVPLFPRLISRHFPLSYARETSAPATAKHPFNILPTERVVSQIVTQSYPNQQGRVAGLIRALRNSTTPISYRMLEMHLRRYAGRPDDAIANVNEIASLTLVTQEPQEKSIFVLYRRCAERCLVYAANLRLSKLQQELSAVLRVLRQLLPESSVSPVDGLSEFPAHDEDIMGTVTSAASIPIVPISPELEERWLKSALSRYPRCAVKGFWEHEASSSFSFVQMALYLREEALERVLSWERAALVYQTAFRMLRVRRWYVATQRFRADSAITIQCAWRSLGAREARALLESQQQSPYEQRLDKRTGAFFFVYMPTNEKLLEEPRDEVNGGIVPFRPMVQDRLTKRWMLAWPNYTRATRRPRSSKSAKAESPWVPCSLCVAERAARRCNECYSSTGDYVDFCLACFYDRHLPVAAVAGSEDISWHTYTALNALRTPYFRCVECSRASTQRCLPCNEHYCKRCFARVHARGKTRSRHAREWYAAQAAPCVECEMRVACQRCLTCQDSLCETCMARTHARGRRADGNMHTIGLLQQPLDPDTGDVYCEQCRARRGDERCEFCSQTLCAVCHWSSSSPTGVQSSLHARVCVETALAEKRRELLGDQGLCVECGKAADRECATCGDHYCSVRWMGNPGCFERFHSKGKRANHTFTMVEVPTEMPREIIALEEQVRAKRRRDAEAAEHEAKRIAAALLEDGGAELKKENSSMRKKKTKKTKSKKKMDASDGRKTCAIPQCRRQALALGIPGVSFCPKHFTLQHALEIAGQDPLEAARLLALVESGGGRTAKRKKTGWRALLPGSFFSREHRKPEAVLAKAKKTSSSVQAESTEASA